MAAWFRVTVSAIVKPGWRMVASRHGRRWCLARRLVTVAMIPVLPVGRRTQAATRAEEKQTNA